MMKSQKSRLLVSAFLALCIVSVAMAVTLQGGNSGGVVVSVDAVANALRVIPYDARGNMAGQKATYSGATAAKTATAAGTGPFFSICGSSTKTVRVQRVVVSGTVGTAAVYGDVELIKTSTATSAGTPTALTKVPHDSTSAAATANLVNYYTALGTAGSPVGPVNSQTAYFPITATVTLGPGTVDFDYRGELEAEAPVLRGTAQCLEASFGTTTTNAPTLSVSVVWTEE